MARDWDKTKADALKLLDEGKSAKEIGKLVGVANLTEKTLESWKAGKKATKKGRKAPSKRTSKASMVGTSPSLPVNDSTTLNLILGLPGVRELVKKELGKLGL